MRGGGSLPRDPRGLKRAGRTAPPHGCFPSRATPPAGAPTRGQFRLFLTGFHGARRIRKRHLDASFRAAPEKVADGFLSDPRARGAGRDDFRARVGGPADHRAADGPGPSAGAKSAIGALPAASQQPGRAGGKPAIAKSSVRAAPLWAGVGGSAP